MFTHCSNLFTSSHVELSSKYQPKLPQCKQKTPLYQQMFGGLNRVTSGCFCFTVVTISCYVT